MSILEQPPIISLEQISKLIGKKRFEELRPQLEQFKIDILEQSNQASKASVDGFQVQLKYRNKTLEGACNCPESDGFDFCLHCAALCLHLNKNTQQISSLAKGPEKSRVLAYLLSQDKQQLAKDFLTFINNDSELFERYLLRAALHKEHLDYSALKSQITELTRKPEKLFSQRQVKHFFAKIERFLDELNALESYSEPDKMLKLIEHVYLRLIRLLDTIDDNSGQRSECVDTYRSLFRKLLTQLHGREETKAKRFFKLWINDNHSIFPANLETFLEEPVLEKFLAQLTKLCLEKEKKNSLADHSPTQQEKILRYLLDTYVKRNECDKANKLRSRLEQLRT